MRQRRDIGLKFFGWSGLFSGFRRGNYLWFPLDCRDILCFGTTTEAMCQPWDCLFREVCNDLRAKVIGSDCFNNVHFVQCSGHLTTRIGWAKVDALLDFFIPGLHSLGQCVLLLSTRCEAATWSGVTSDFVTWQFRFVTSHPATSFNVNAFNKYGHVCVHRRQKVFCLFSSTALPSNSSKATVVSLKVSFEFTCALTE